MKAIKKAEVQSRIKNTKSIMEGLSDSSTVIFLAIIW